MNEYCEEIMFLNIKIAQFLFIFLIIKCKTVLSNIIHFSISPLCQTKTLVQEIICM